MQSRYFNSRSGMTIYIGNLPLQVTETQIMGIFEPFGQVVGVYITNDKYLGRKNTFGYAYVEMAAREDGKQAIAALDGRTMGNIPLSLVESLPITPIKEKIVRPGNRVHKVRERRWG